MRPLLARSPARLTHVVALLLVLNACDNNETRIYTARPYQVDPGCLDAYVSLAVVYAEDLRATCAPACLNFDGQLYVSTVCPPYPEGAEVLEAGADADCDAALSALEQDLSCDSELPVDVPADSEEPADAEVPSPAPADGGATPDGGAPPDGG